MCAFCTWPKTKENCENAKIIKQNWEREKMSREWKREMCFWHKHESQWYSNATHISNGLYSMAFIAFYVWKMERTLQTIKLFTCWLFFILRSLSLFSSDSLAIVVQMHTHTHTHIHSYPHILIMMVALFCITLVLLIRHQHNRHIPFEIHSTAELMHIAHLNRLF